MTESMTNALKGNGGGLQSVSNAVGDVMGNASDMRGGSSKKADTASSELGEMANPSKGGQTTEGTSVSGKQQVENMSSGSADHLDMGFRK